MSKSSITTRAIATPNRVTAHPGEVLNGEFLKPLRMSVNALAMALRVPATRIGAIVKGKSAHGKWRGNRTRCTPARSLNPTRLKDLNCGCSTYDRGRGRSLVSTPPWDSRIWLLPWVLRLSRLNGCRSPGAHWVRLAPLMRNSCRCRENLSLAPAIVCAFSQSSAR
jgi:hypothetical protein